MNFRGAGSQFLFVLTKLDVVSSQYAKLIQASGHIFIFNAAICSSNSEPEGEY